MSRAADYPIKGAPPDGTDRSDERAPIRASFERHAIREEDDMAEKTETTEAFRAEVRAWLDENFPKSLVGRAAEVMGGESISETETDALEWGRRLGAKGWATPPAPEAGTNLR